MPVAPGLGDAADAGSLPIAVAPTGPGAGGGEGVYFFLHCQQQFTGAGVWRGCEEALYRKTLPPGSRRTEDTHLT